MKFGEALEEVKKGALIARAGWNGKGITPNSINLI